MTRPGLNLSLHKQTELKPKQWVLNQKAIKKRATFACSSLIVKVVPPVLLKLNFNQVDSINLITNMLYIKHFQFD